MAFYGIDTPVRQAAFLSQVGHESGGLKHLREVWGPTEAQKCYEGRKDLGNYFPGDGQRFSGHGLLQTTGRRNHIVVRDRLRLRFDNVPDFEADPDALMDPQWASLSACDYWDMKGLNEIADAGDFELVTRRINGGLNGYEDRLERWGYAKKALGIA
jgi:putative chitinase